MFITRMSLPRRTFLRGLGTTVALPLLDAMVPALTAAAKTSPGPVRRVGFVYVPNGVIMDQWTPTKLGVGPELPPILKPLEPFRDQLVVISNTSRPGSDPDHALASSGWLSGATAKETEGQDFRVGTTIDQVVATQIGHETPFPSLEVATEDFAGYVGGCSPGYACAYVNTLSWSTPTTPLPMEINPRVVFERLFGRAGTLSQRLERIRTNRSVLDSIMKDLAQLNRGLSVRDKNRLDEYLGDIREIEQRIERMEARSHTGEIGFDTPVGVPPQFADHVGMLFDLLTVAYQADLSRVFTFMMAREFSMKTYPDIGVPEPHHSVSHHQNKPQQIGQHAKINVHHMEQFARFIGKLHTTPDGDGTLLDHSLVFYGAGLSNGNIHSPYPLPLLALGGSGAGNRHVQAPPETPIGNLWVGLANKFGSDISALGDSTGALDLL
jgi:hypothetical protein